jgi:hypothetical protein
MYLKRAYLAFFQGVFLYGLRLWGGAGETNRILLIQKKVVRLLTNTLHDSLYRPMFIDVGVMTFYSLYVLVSVLHIRKILIP